MYPFVFNPFGRNNTVNILDLVIPKVKTIAIGESTENVVLGICYIAYFNKCDNVIQLMNYTPAPAA